MRGIVRLRFGGVAIRVGAPRLELEPAPRGQCYRLDVRVSLTETPKVGVINLGFDGRS